MFVQNSKKTPAPKEIDASHKLSKKTLLSPNVSKIWGYPTPKSMKEVLLKWSPLSFLPLRGRTARTDAILLMPEMTRFLNASICSSTAKTRL